MKLGGASITDKGSVVPALDDDSLNISIRALAHLYARNQLHAVVHGAGSYAHPVVKQTNASHGWISSSGVDATARLGWARARAGVEQLSAILVQRVTEYMRMPITLLPPGSLGWRKLSADTQPIHEVAQCISCGIVPLLRGDGVFDDAFGGCIISADDVILRLATCCGVFEDAPRCAVFVTAVEGVLSSPNSSHIATDIFCRQAEIMEVRWMDTSKAEPHIYMHGISSLQHCTRDAVDKDKHRSNPHGAWIVRMSEATNTGIDFLDGASNDTTGGMAAKLRAAMRLCTECDMKVVICNAPNFERLANDEPFRGTVLHRAEE